MKKLFVVIFFYSIFFQAMGSVKLAWKNYSDPMIMNPSFLKEVSRLPLSGSANIKNRFWEGDIWALRNGNINFRWNADERIGFNLKSPNRNQLLTMTAEQIAQLAPSEKYDLYVGRYDYPLKRMVAKISSPDAQPWEGICNGWASATVNHDQPVPKTLKNPDGVSIPFGSADIKGLLSFYYAFVNKPDTNHFMGRRCTSDNPSSDQEECGQDLNAGAFHIALTNLVGLKSVGLIGDLTPTSQVWNYPIYKYEATILGEGPVSKLSAPGTTKVLKIETHIQYQSEGLNQWQAVEFQENPVFTKRYEYLLDLNQEGHIIGGLWLSEDRPDFLWSIDPPKEFIGVLSKLGDLLK